MFANALNHLAISLPTILRSSAVKQSPLNGPMPTWINDPQLSKQLLKDTGLTLDDLGGRPVYDDEKPFFMQSNYW